MSETVFNTFVSKISLLHTGGLVYFVAVLR
jgi:hypothetical protein